MKTPMEREEEMIENFWRVETQKCLYQVERKKKRKQDEEEAEKRKSIEEAMWDNEVSKANDENAIKEWEAAEELEYMDLVMRTRLEFGEIKEKEYQEWKEEQKKK